MTITPTLAQVKAHLRIDYNDLDPLIEDRITQAAAEMLTYLGRSVYESQTDMDQAEDESGVVLSADMLNAQCLLVQAYLDGVEADDGRRAKAAALAILHPYRMLGV